ncbi:MAG: hypothetical protein HYU51_10430 [Candidatus Rokubacteria bacterium]|nr:hypothetical protein [Candidatus Rokubacteria bacterium]
MRDGSPRPSARREAPAIARRRRTVDPWFEEVWARFVEEYRRSRAPEALRQRIIAALHAERATARKRKEMA